jgi:hypothetical protein
MPNPESEDDLRPISLTAFFSKVLEQFIVMWLLDVIGEKIDFRQYGGTKGNSVAHYLIELINFILFNQDSREPRAVLACLVDFSKAFNRQDHSILVTKLSDMGVPGWLLRLVVAFLKERTMVVRYKGKISGVKQLPGGGPQGTLLGLLLFLVLINDLGGNNQSNNIGEIITCRRRLKQVNEIHLKYVDDLALAEAIDMKSQLKTVPVAERPQPDVFRARTGHALINEDSTLLAQLEKTQKYAEDNNMKINTKKTKFMVFNPGTSRDFMPKFIMDGNEIEVVEETRLLGVVVRSDLTWSSNTDDVVKRANNKLWCLRRLKNLGVETSDLLDVYTKQVRSILEYAAPVWHSSISGEDRLKIERVQKSALHIILGESYQSYRSALKFCKLETLFERRRKLTYRFAKKSEKSPKFSQWFKPNTKVTVTRQEQPKYCPVFSRTSRFERSPVSYFTSLLNSE